MGKARKTRKFAATKRLINPNDQRIKSNQQHAEQKQRDAAAEGIDGEKINQVQKVSSSMFLSYNTALGPPYHVLVDTNFINFSITNKLDIMMSMIDCLLGKAIVCVTQCVIGELEKLGTKYRVALRIAKDPRFERLPCTHNGTYADDCIVSRCMQHKCYIVATCDRDLKRRIRKIPGVPIMYIAQHKYVLERFGNSVGLKSAAR
jgi:U3 small nucleolar RNA-associated protein 24